MPELARTVAEGFAERIREQEDAWLSPLAVRSYETRGRAEPEADSDLRTPFQRDRDRIVHSKAFRRLKHKTQVFVAPEGDHYRTRLTHTLEASGIARAVARALRLNEDLTEAIGLGHDLGHPPFGHAGEEALDALLRERYGSGFRHNEHSLRVVDVLERDGRGLNLTEEVRDGILNHTGEDAPATLEGRIVRSSTASPTSTTTSTTPCAAACSRTRTCPRAEIELLGDTGSRAHRHARPRPRRALGGRRRHRAERRDRRRDAALRSFMFDRVYLGPGSQAEHERARRDRRADLRPPRAHPEELPPAPGELPQRVTDYLAGMTDRYALAVRGGARSRWRGSRTRRSSAVRAGGRHRRARLRRARSSARSAPGALGRCPFHEERTPSFSVNAVDKLYHCFGCGASGDAITFVEEKEGLDFAGAVELLADRFRVQLEYDDESPAAGRRAPPPAAAAARCSSRRRPSTSATSGIRRRASRCARTWPGAGWARRSAASSGSASRRAGRSSSRRRAAQGFTPQELAAAGLSRRGGDYFSGRLLFPLADARGRVVGFQARKLSEDDPMRAKYVNSPEGELFRKGDLLYGLVRRAQRDREAGTRGRGRGQHRRARAAPGRRRAGGRVDGHGAHRASRP